MRPRRVAAQNSTKYGVTKVGQMTTKLIPMTINLYQCNLVSCKNNYAKVGHPDVIRQTSRPFLWRLMVFQNFTKSQSWHQNTLIWYHKSHGHFALFSKWPKT